MTKQQQLHIIQRQYILEFNEEGARRNILVKRSCSNILSGRSVQKAII